MSPRVSSRKVSSGPSVCAKQWREGQSCWAPLSAFGFFVVCPVGQPRAASTVGFVGGPPSGPSSFRMKARCTALKSNLAQKLLSRTRDLRKSCLPACPGSFGPLVQCRLRRWTAEAQRARKCQLRQSHWGRRKLLRRRVGRLGCPPRRRRQAGSCGLAEAS